MLVVATTTLCSFEMGFLLRAIDYRAIVNPLCYCSFVQVLTTGDVGEDAECHAAKLLEVILIQYKGLIDQVHRCYFSFLRILLCVSFHYG